MDDIRISIPCGNLGFPYLECKTHVSPNYTCNHCHVNGNIDVAFNIRITCLYCFLAWNECILSVRWDNSAIHWF